jgi:hypothetical protein
MLAVPRAAGPLAGVAARFAAGVFDFKRVRWARLVQRTGGLCVPFVSPAVDVDGAPLDTQARRKAAGVRDDETEAGRAARQAALLRMWAALLVAARGAPAPQRVRVSAPLASPACRVW